MLNIENRIVEEGKADHARQCRGDFESPGSRGGFDRPVVGAIINRPKIADRVRNDNIQ